MDRVEGAGGGLSRDQLSMRPDGFESAKRRC